MIVAAGVGIGRACAERLASEGPWVAVGDLDIAAAEDVSADLRPLTGSREHLALPIDMTDRSSVEQAADHLAQKWGVVRCGGDGRRRDTLTETSSQRATMWQRMRDLNLMATVRGG